MAAAAQITIEEYLRTPFHPDAEYVNGVIEERNGGEYDHSVVQWAILDWFRRHDKQWQTRTLQEQRTRLKTGNVRIPDVAIWARSVPIEPVFSHSPLVVVEVLSPEDRQSRLHARIEDYREAGVTHIWVVDPSRRLGWDCSDGNWIAKTRFEVSNSAAFLDLYELFTALDEAEA